MGSEHEKYLFPSVIYEERHCVPTNEVIYPNNLEIFHQFNEIKSKINNNTSFTWWTDGSLRENKYGGYAYCTLQERNKNNKISLFGYVNHCTNINYCELIGIKAALNESISDNNIMKYEYVNIITDSATCLFNLDVTGQCKDDYYYDMIQEIYLIIHNIQEYDVNVRLIKIPAHEGWLGNELADRWAKYGSWIAMKMDQNCMKR